MTRSIPNFLKQFSRREKRVLMVAISLLLFSICLHFPLAKVGDRNYVLFVAEQLVAGKLLYQNILDPNPPLIFWLYTTPIYLSHFFPFLQAYQFLALLGITSCLFSITLSLAVLQFHPALIANRKNTLWVFLLLAFPFIEFVLPNYFFDREHIFLTLTFPYIIRNMPSVVNSRLNLKTRWLIAVCAGVGFCIKPYCIVVFLGIQIVTCLYKRNLHMLLQVENCIIYTMGILYVVLVMLFTPQYLDIVIPMAFATYSASFVAGSKLLYACWAFFILAVTLSDWRSRYHSPFRLDILYLLSLYPFFLLYAFLNGPWGYIWDMVVRFTLIITGFVLLQFLHLKNTALKTGTSPIPYIFGIHSCFIVLFLHSLAVFCYFYLYLTNCDGFKCASYQAFLSDIVEINDHKEPRAFAAISSEFDIWSDLGRYHDIKWVSRFPNMWMLPGFLKNDAYFNQHNQWIQAYIARAFAEDLATYKPELVFVDDKEGMFTISHYVDLIAWFSHFPVFQKEWQHYRFVREIAPPVGGRSAFVAHTPMDDISSGYRSGYYVYKRIDSPGK